jgi:CCR4-NOT transcription complex subunit 1
VEQFVRVATEVVVEACLKNAVVNDSDDLHRTTLSYTIVDAYAKLLFLLVKYNGDATARVNILQRILKAVVSALREAGAGAQAAGAGAEPGQAGGVAGGLQDPRPYFRLFVDLLHDFNAFDPALDTTHNIQVLTAFAIAFNNLQPSVVPGFAFAWLELISHRMFMPALLLAKGQKGWILMHRLLIDLFSFLEPFLRKAELNDPIRILYKGTLRVLLVLLHDFPEFLCDYHVSFCDVIPPTCIQLRNLILSAFPRNMRLPDPFTPNLKVDLLPEIAQPPRIPAGYTAALLSLKGEVDAYLKTRQPASFLAELPAKLRLPPSTGATGGIGGGHPGGDGGLPAYNTPAMNALVIYVGAQAIAQLQAKQQQQGGVAGAGAGAGAMTGSMAIAHSAPMDIFQALMKELDAEGRYAFLNAVANQLRYPNNQTHYFSCVLLFLFAEAGSDLLKEQITRVLLERLIVHRPHPVRACWEVALFWCGVDVLFGCSGCAGLTGPTDSLHSPPCNTNQQWGLLITFIELIKNPRYNFWQHGFTRCATEIERVFESVARSCMGQQGAGAQPGAAGAEEPGAGASA